MNHQYRMLSSDEDKRLVSQLWDDETCPYFDLVMFGDGRICRLDVRSNLADEPQSILSGNMARISDVPGLGDPNQMNEGFGALCRREYPSLDLVISGGECFSSGGNGFVAATELSSGALKWLVFFVLSNPFDTVDLEGETVVATSTNHRKYYIPIEYPERVRLA